MKRKPLWLFFIFVGVKASSLCELPRENIIRGRERLVTFTGVDSTQADGSVAFLNEKPRLQEDPFAVSTVLSNELQMVLLKSDSPLCYMAPKIFAQTGSIECVLALFDNLKENFDFEETLFLFDFDETLARSQELVKLYNTLRAKYPGRVFVYSAGTIFVKHSKTIGLSTEDKPECLPNRLNENRNWIECEAETGLEFSPPRWHLPRSDDHTKGALSYYNGIGFFAHPHESHSDGSVKALHLRHIIDIVGPGVKNMIFIDDQFEYAYPMAIVNDNLDNKAVIHFHE